jgi:IclR family transcriptional regulator, KDG regulon repressor
MLGTLRRAGAVLDLFTTEEPEWGVTATAQRLGIGKSLAHDILSSLAAIGLLQRVGHGRYRLGWRTISLASVLLRTSELKAQARPVVRELAERQRLPVSLVAWGCDRIIYLDCRRDRRYAGDCAPVAGTAVPLDGSAIAKVLLAGRPAHEVEVLWSDGLVRSGHTSLDELASDLDRVRLLGWARDDAEGSVRSCTVAAPVRDPEGVVAAAIGLDLADRVSRINADAHTRAVVAAASKISAAMRRAEPARAAVA